MKGFPALIEEMLRRCGIEVHAADRIGNQRFRVKGSRYAFAAPGGALVCGLVTVLGVTLAHDGLRVGTSGAAPDVVIATVERSSPGSSKPKQSSALTITSGSDAALHGSHHPHRARRHLVDDLSLISGQRGIKRLRAGLHPIRYRCPCRYHLLLGGE